VARRVGMAAAEDLAAEVFVRAFRSRQRCRFERGSALPWLLGVANHVITDQRRVERRRLAALERLAQDRQEAIKHPDGALARIHRLVGSKRSKRAVGPLMRSVRGQERRWLARAPVGRFRGAVRGCARAGLIALGGGLLSVDCG
jgi:DNA-directed RNA polymerase specialized sigma24 family protein